MCGGEGDHFVDPEKMPTGDLCQYFRNNMDTMFYHKAKSQYQQFIEARRRYILVLTELKTRFKFVSLDFLVKLSNENQASLGVMDPDHIPDTSETISDVAKKEIHRRTLKGMSPNKKRKVDATYLGYPRKPKF